MSTTSLSFFCRPRGSEKNDADAPENPFEKINVFAAVLAAVLTALTFIAQKSGIEARHEAERLPAVRESAGMGYWQNFLAVCYLKPSASKMERCRI
ncbi:MAG: hypothetical protein IPQ01_01920 [Zoogloea sp.]|nr:hypothetical protein [Zoogloea sp.]